MRSTQKESDLQLDTIPTHILHLWSEHNNKALEKIYNDQKLMQFFNGVSAQQARLLNRFLLINYDYSRYRQQNNRADLTDNQYASIRVGLDLFNEAMTGILTERVLNRFGIPGPGYGTAAFLALSDMFEQYGYQHVKTYQQDREKLLNSLSEKDQTSFREIEMLGGPYTFNMGSLVASFNLNHFFKKVIEKADNLQIDVVADALNTASTSLENFAKDQVNALASKSKQTALSIHWDELLAPFKKIKLLFGLGNVAESIKEEYQVTSPEALTIIANSLLEGTPLQQLYLEDGGPEIADVLPEGVSRTDITNNVKKQINDHPELSIVKKELEQTESFADRLIRIRESKELFNQGISDSLLMGQTVAQLGQLTNSKGLYQAGAVFQNGIQIVSQLNKLNILTDLPIVKQIGSLNLGPISMIASSVMSIIGLFTGGPSAEEIIMEQLEEIQNGINSIINNQAIILNAMGYYYQNLLAAINNGIKYLSELVTSEFERVHGRFDELDDRLSNSVREIIDEIRRAEFAIDQSRLSPLESAIDFSRNFEHRYPNLDITVYHDELRHNMQTLERWASQTVCDPSFTGDVEVKYEDAIDRPSVLLRHFPSNQINSQDVLIQLGFLHQIFQTLMPMNESFNAITCNMVLWSQAITAYQNLLPYSSSFSYDPNDVLVKEMLKPAQNIRLVISDFQKHAYTFFSAIQTKIIQDIRKITANIKSDLLAIKEDIHTYQNEVLVNERNKLQKFIDNIPDPHGGGGLYFTTSISGSVLRSSASQYVPMIDARINDNKLDFTRPLISLVDGAKLPFYANNQGPAQTVFHPTFQPLENNGYQVPQELMKAESLGVGNFTATFAYTYANMDSGQLTCDTTLFFHYPNGDKFTVADVTWRGRLERRQVNKSPLNIFLDNHSPRVLNTYEPAMAVFNSLPLYNWDTNSCVNLLANQEVCIRWSNQVNYVITNQHEHVKEVTQLNNAEIFSRVNKRAFESVTQTGTKFSDSLNLLESKWRVMKAFALIAGLDTRLLHNLEEFNILDALLEEIAATQSYDIEGNHEVPLLEPRLIQRFDGIFTDILTQTKPRSSNSTISNTSQNNLTSAGSTNSTSTLTHFIKRIEQDLNMAKSLRDLQQSLLETNKFVNTRIAAGVDSPAPNTVNQAHYTSHDSGFSWPSFWASLTALAIPTALIITQMCIAQRRLMQANRNNAAQFIPLMPLGTALLANQEVAEAATAMEYRETIDVSDNTFALQDTLTSNSLISTSVGGVILFNPAQAYQDQVNYFGKWDYNAHTHSYTGQPVFTYQIHDDTKIVGTAEFYKHPLLCRSADGMRHNVIKLTGVLNAFNPDQILDQVNDVCESLPPTQLEQFTDGLTAGTVHGIFRASSNTLKSTLQHHGYSESIADRARIAYYYLAMFSASTLQNYLRDEDNPDELSRFYNATKTAAVETLTLSAASFALTKASEALSHGAKQLAKSGWTKAGNILGNVARHGTGLLIYGYNGYQKGVAHVAGAIAGGLMAEKVIGDLESGHKVKMK